MTPPGAVLLLCLQAILQEAYCSFQPTGRRILPRPNTVLGVDSSCSADTLTVKVRLEKPFSGMLYSRGFPLECRSHGSGEEWASIVLPSASCGVKVIVAEDGSMSYSVVLQVQLDRYLQQAADQEHTAVCQVPQSSPTHHLRPAARTGRKQSAVRGLQEKQWPVGEGSARAWMEISGSRKHSYVSVGEPTKLRIKALLPAGRWGLRVTECVAHDGAGDSSQRLLDDDGCPIDETLLPAFSLTSPSPQLRVAQAVFPAFKFPDRDSLHLRCQIHVCTSACPQAQCNDWTNPSPAKLQAGEVVERMEVFNSVQVLAPGIETYDMRTMDSIEDAVVLPRQEVDGRSVCMSPPKLAVVLCVLVLVFLGGAATVLWTLWQTRRPPHRRWFHSHDSLLVMDSPQLSHRTHWHVLR